MDSFTTFVATTVNLGFAVAVASYLLIRTTNIMTEVMKTLCELKNSIRLLAEKVENLKR